MEDCSFALCGRCPLPEDKTTTDGATFSFIIASSALLCANNEEPVTLAAKQSDYATLCGPTGTTQAPSPTRKITLLLPDMNAIRILVVRRPTPLWIFNLIRVAWIEFVRLLLCILVRVVEDYRQVPPRLSCMEASAR